jgi:hypothetical protein
VFHDGEGSCGCVDTHAGSKRGNGVLDVRHAMADVNEHGIECGKAICRT